MNTILITGCSSGYGLETARFFLDRGWTVIATMRTPREDVLPRSERLRVLALEIPDLLQQANDPIVAHEDSRRPAWPGGRRSRRSSRSSLTANP